MARRRHRAQARNTHRGRSGAPTRSGRARSGCPTRRVDPDDPERVWRRVPIGDLADLFLIDTRTRRDEPVPEPAMSDPARTALGPEQRAWLFSELAESTARWRLLANPSVMGQTWHPDLPDAVRNGLRKVKLIADDMQGPDFDQWDGYPAERDALFEHIIEHDMNNVVVLSGDVHVSLALELHRNPFDSTDHTLAVEFVTPSLTSQNLDDKMGWPRRRRRVTGDRSARRSSSSRTGSGSTSTVTATSSSTSLPTGSRPSGGTSTPCSSDSPYEERGAVVVVPHGTSGSSASPERATRGDSGRSRPNSEIALPRASLCTTSASSPAMISSATARLSGHVESECG